MPKLKTRIVLTIIIIGLFAVVAKFYGLLYSPLTGVATAAQFDDSVTSYATAKLIRDGTPESGVFWLMLFFVALIWIGPVARSIRARKIAVLLSVAAVLSNCAPVKVLDVVEVKSNETAWAIPLDAMSQTGQVKFNSVDFLNQKKIASKRIMVDKIQRKIGRFYWSIEWIPATRVIVVDRSLVTRQWTDGTPDNPKDDYGIGVVTQDSVKLRVGLTVTASIEEDDASTYLYYHGARELAQVLDQNIRSFAVSELTREYSQLNLMEAQTKGDEIYALLFKNAAAAFKSKGVTIQYLGNAEGLTYADPLVQKAINARYLAEQDARTAEQEQAAQRVRNATRIFNIETDNKTTLLNAQTQADASKKLFDAKESATFQNDLSIRLMAAQAALKWNGALPANILPANSPMLLNLGAKTP